MALKLDAVGKQIGPISKEYTWKDCVLYALGVGAGFSDLEYCYEKDLKVIPSFSITTLYSSIPEALTLTNINLAGMLHGEQDLIFHNPIPPEGTMTTQGKISHIYDKGEGKGALIIAESDTVHSNGQKLFTAISTVFARLDGGFGGEEAPRVVIDFPDREPDFIIDASPTENQPLIYRLSGDVFQLHVDPEFAKMAGFEKPIMHGLCTHGFACRALIQALIPGEPEKARRMACRFTKPLYPGMPLKTYIWKTGTGKAVWRVQNTETDEVVIDNGVFEYGDIPKDEIRFDNRVAVVTGAGAGLGRVYALELAKRGAKVVVNDFGGARDGSGAGSSSPADQVVGEIKALGGEAVANYDNVATKQGGENIVQTAVETFGTLDILINNAGILRDKSFLKMEPENWHSVIDVHLNGAYYVSQPAFNVMKEQGYGRIIMTTSAAGLYGNFGQTNYTAAKMGIVGLMNTLKLEGQKYDIKVNTVAPVAASRLTEDVLPPDFFEKLKPEFVAPLVLYLCAEECPVTGNVYNAGMGFYNRAAIVTGPGAVVGDGKEIPTPEEIVAAWDSIATLDDAKEYSQVTEQIGDLLTAFSPKKAETRDKPAGKASVADIFASLPDAFQSNAADGVDIVFQFNISGPGGGDWYCIIKDNTCTVDTGVHEKALCTLKMEDADFVDLMSGDLPAMQAYTSGKLRIEGDILKSQLIEKVFKF
jgi:NAD(P)-dependent dehydrogenase (short-subunit alcohol dehydrogenase family)/acyl dehydratase/putative sterol carrier protein